MSIMMQLVVVGVGLSVCTIAHYINERKFPKIKMSKIKGIFEILLTMAIGTPILLLIISILMSYPIFFGILWFLWLLTLKRG